MAWIVEDESSQAELASQFRQQVQRSAILQIPGAYDGLTALLARKAGFEALYLSGAAFSASRGLPDLGMLHSEEVAARAREIVRATNLPLLVDIDTGYGGILNVARAAKEMVEARVAAVQIEDQDLPKKCGHLNGKRLVSCEDMVEKIKVIKEVCPTLMVVARTDARAVEGMDSAMERVERYAETGADVIFPEALTNEVEFRQMTSSIKVPFLANMTEFGKTPYFTADEFQNWGYAAVIYPVTALRIASHAVESAFLQLKASGSQKSMLTDMQTREELYETIQYREFERLDSTIAATILPPRTERDPGDLKGS